MNAQLVLSQPEASRWSAVFSLFLGVTSLIAAEFMPVSLLTSIARDLAVTEGMAGQSVTMVGAFSVLASLLVSPLTKSMDRRRVMLAFSLLLILSHLLVALAPTYLVLLMGRGLLGICVGGFWSLVPAVTLQLVPAKELPRALSIVYAGVSVATILSLPLASYLGHLAGWRNVFLAASLLGVIVFVWQYLVLPTLPARPGGGVANMFALLRQGRVLAGMGGIMFSYGGYHIFFTYLRPFLDHKLALAPDVLSGTLLVFGMANCLGTFAAGFALSRWFRLTLPTVLLVFAGVALMLLFSQEVALNLALVITWGFLFGFIPVGWSAWIARTLADKAELAGGLSVAITQFSIGLVAAAGGALFDFIGITGIFAAAALLLLAAMVLARRSLTPRVHGEEE